ncbi:DNA-dependent protein kinase catalytic subunit [Frankliniella fusca]|uniref:DNA-dependent protein kinase catalytic subunit n=1 Tax=Frankliniella fusca TaxID=407009 RepID=A0AAE1I0F3_9NEOP|nr:DNA-dependent protein kinase catalytic subunit [Frankliniella fusca]
MAYDYFADRVRNPILEHRRRARNIEIWRYRLRDRQDPLDITVEAFVELYRMPQDVFLLLLNCLQPYARRCVSHRASPFYLRLWTALYYFATGSYQEHTGSNTHHLLSQAAVSNAIEEVTNALNHPMILTSPPRESCFY